MEMNAIIQDFLDHSVRTEEIFHLGTMCIGGTWPNGLKDAFEYDTKEVVQAIDIPDVVDTEKAEEVEAYLLDTGKTGFLVKFATPVPNDFSYACGYYTTHWIYADDYETACKRCVELARKALEEAKAEEAAKRDKEGNRP